MLTCDTCSAVDVIAIAPGSEPERGDLLSALADVPLSRGVARCQWCRSCWPWLRRGEQAAAAGERVP